MIFVQDTDSDYMTSESQAAARTVNVPDGDSSGPSDTEEMSDVLKKDPIISKYCKYRVTKKTTQQNNKRKYDFVHAHTIHLHYTINGLYISKWSVHCGCSFVITSFILWLDGLFSVVTARWARSPPE